MPHVLIVTDRTDGREYRLNQGTPEFDESIATLADCIGITPSRVLAVLEDGAMLRTAGYFRRLEKVEVANVQ